MARGMLRTGGLALSSSSPRTVGSWSFCYGRAREESHSLADILVQGSQTPGCQVTRSVPCLSFPPVPQTPVRGLACVSLGAPKDLRAAGEAKVPGETSLRWGHVPPPALGSEDHQQPGIRGAGPELFILNWPLSHGATLCPPSQPGVRTWEVFLLLLQLVGHPTPWMSAHLSVVPGCAWTTTMRLARGLPYADCARQLRARGA